MSLLHSRRDSAVKDLLCLPAEVDHGVLPLRRVQAIVLDLDVDNDLPIQLMPLLFSTRHRHVYHVDHPILGLLCL